MEIIPLFGIFATILDSEIRKYTMNMKRFAGWTCALAAALFLSCSDDDVKGSLAFDTPAVFFADGDTAPVTVHFTASNLNSFSVSSTPTGWDGVVLDPVACTVTVTPPDSFDDDEAKTGSIVLSGKGGGGATGSASLFVGVVEQKEFSERANSYIVNQKETNYLLDVEHRSDGATLATVSVELIWQNPSSLIQYLSLKNGKASFYVGADSDDDTKIKSGNAVIGAYDAAGKLLWSWHIWVADYDPSAAGNQKIFNGYTMMDRNLGARAAGNDSTDDILASYGLYYQWGRKDPFIGPSTYNFASGSAATLYNGSNTSITVTPAASSSSNGTMEYAQLNPYIFITGVEDSDYDWLWSAHSATLWTAPGSTKSLYDPCPAGWRVAPAAAFEGLTPDAESLGWENTKYSVTLEKEGVSSLFMGAGRRTYLDGKFQNVYVAGYDPKGTRADEAQPWIGLYWTADAQTSDNLSSALYFRYGSSEEVQNAYALRRSTGLPVRCVKSE